jgi:hypothetical protein
VDVGICHYPFVSWDAWHALFLAVAEAVAVDGIQLKGFHQSMAFRASSRDLLFRQKDSMAPAEGPGPASPESPGLIFHRANTSCDSRALL